MSDCPQFCLAQGTSPDPSCCGCLRDRRGGASCEWPRMPFRKQTLYFLSLAAQPDTRIAVCLNWLLFGLAEPAGPGRGASSKLSKTRFVWLIQERARAGRVVVTAPILRQSGCVNSPTRHRIVFWWSFYLLQLIVIPSGSVFIHLDETPVFSHAVCRRTYAVRVRRDTLARDPHRGTIYSRRWSAFPRS